MKQTFVGGAVVQAALGRVSIIIKSVGSNSASFFLLSSAYHSKIRLFLEVFSSEF